MASVCTSYVKSPTVGVSTRCFDLSCYSKFGTVVLGRRKYLGLSTTEVYRDFVARGEAARPCRQQPRNPHMRISNNFDSKQSNCKCTTTTTITHITTITVLLLLIATIIVVVIIYYYAY